MTEWITFFCAVCAGAVLIVAPGMILLKGLRFRPIDAVACSPIASIGLFVAVGILLHLLSISASGKSIAAISFLIALGVFLATLPFRREARKASSKKGIARKGSWVVLALYLVVGFLVSLYAFVEPIDGPESFSASYDNASHLSRIRIFLESGIFCTLHSGVSLADQATSSFYPCAWQIMAALVSDCTSVSVSASANITNVLFCALVLPMGAFSIFYRVFPHDRHALLSGSFFCICFAAFPWALLTAGQLSSNLAGFALVPSFLTLFWELRSSLENRDKRISRILAVILGLFSLAVAQTNALFTAGIFCLPIIHLYVKGLIDSRANGSKSLNSSIASACLVAVLASLLWMAAYKLPFLQSVVSFNWPAEFGKSQAVMNVLTLSFVSALPSQPILSFLVIVGFIACASRRPYRYFAVLFVLLSTIYVVDVSTEGTMKHILSGFWYTDRYRTAAMVAMSGVPLACVGFSSILAIAHKHTANLKIDKPKTALSLIYLLMLLLILYPNCSIRGIGEIKTGFGEVRSLISSSYSTEGILDSEERLFLKDVQNIAGNEVVLNIPADGSAWVHGAIGLNTYYRTFFTSSEQDDTLLRTHLDEAAYREDVLDIIHSAEAKYVLILDEDMSNNEKVYTYTYDEAQWTGFNSLKDDTPGFTLVLSESDMRLYRIDI